MKIKTLIVCTSSKPRLCVSIHGWDVLRVQIILLCLLQNCWMRGKGTRVFRCTAIVVQTYWMRTGSMLVFPTFASQYLCLMVTMDVLRQFFSEKINRDINISDSFGLLIETYKGKYHVHCILYAGYHFPCKASLLELSSVLIHSPTLYIGEHKHGLYALPSLVDSSTVSVITRQSRRPLIEGPRENGDSGQSGSYFKLHDQSGQPERKPKVMLIGRLSGECDRYNYRVH